MKKLIYVALLLFVGILISSCHSDPNPPNKYKWVVDVVYVNGDEETLKITKTSEDGEEAQLYYEDGCLSVTYYDGKWTRNETFACDVRKAKEISVEKTEVQ
jgi:hypothetical protein